MAAPVLSRGLLDALSNMRGDCQTARWALNNEGDAAAAAANDTPENRERASAVYSRAWRLAKIEDAIADLLGVEGVR